MQEAFGGILSLVLIVVFIIIVEGVLGFTVVYTKAFKMKNAVVSTFEEYEAAGCMEQGFDTACKEKIRKDAKKIAYNPTVLNCTDSTPIDGLFCVSQVSTRTENGVQYATYRIITQVDMNFPIVKNILGLRFFQVTGDTREIQLNGN